MKKENDFRFPEDFVWGAACSAFQLEGASYLEGKTANVFEQAFDEPVRRRKFHDNRSPHVGADFYHRYPEDIALFKELGLGSFRFSIAWSRICPDVSGKPNQAGIDFYNHVIDELIAQGITPMFDLFHSDLPYWVIEEGGLCDEKFVDWFTHYAEICFREFGDRVKLWNTVNEPKISVYGAYSYANCAPYIKDEGLALKATQNMLIAHFRTVKLLHEMWPDAQIGAVNNAGKCFSMSFEAQDIEAASRHGAMQLLFLDPMLLGCYPPEVLAYEGIARYISEEMILQLKEEFVPMDFYGINCYCPMFIRSGDTSADGTTYFEPEVPKDAYGFHTYAPAMFDLLMDLKERYGEVPVYITENGFTCRRNVETMTVENDLHDAERISYIREHLRAARRAIRAGVKLKGYYYWSVMDCWEGTMGYGYPMGLISVNFDSLQRTPRDSFYYYQKVIRNKMVD